MSLAQKASVPIPELDPPVRILCHTATWFYAAQEAQDRGLSPRKSTLAILENIARIAPQTAILALARSGKWNFNKNVHTPADGTVLLWEEQPTHSAIVSAHDKISGYNQGNQWPGSGQDYSTEDPKNLIAKWRIVKTIREDTIVKAAGKFNL